MRHLEGEDGCLLRSRPQTRNLLLIDNPYHVEPGVNVGVLALKCFPPEQFLCAEVRIRLHQWVDEVARIQILGFVWIDQDVGEWRSRVARSEEQTSELQSLMRISYAVLCLKKKKKTT